MVRKIVGVLVLLSLAQFCLADKEELVTSEQAVAFGNRLMIEISRGKVQNAWRKLRENSTIPPERIEAFATDYNQRLLQTIQYFGRSTGVELVSQEAFGRSLLRVTYLVKYDVTGVAWYVYFYRKNNQWVVSEFNFDLNSNSVFNNIGSNAPAGQQSLLIQGWQEKIEERIAALERNGGGGGGVTIDPSTVNMDNSAAVMLLQMQAKLVSLEQRSSSSQDVDGRLKALEDKFSMISDRFDAISYQLDLKELAVMRRTLQVLKEQHPFADFP